MTFKRAYVPHPARPPPNAIPVRGMIAGADGGVVCNVLCSVAMEYQRIELITGTPRRRRYTAEQKAAAVMEAMAPGASI